MVQCAVINCSQKADKEKGIRLFCVPSVLKNQCAKTVFLSEHRRAFWIERINKPSLQLKDVKAHTRVCSRHFIKGQASALFDHKNPDWAPSLHMGYDKESLEVIIQRQKEILLDGLERLQTAVPDASDAPEVSKDSDVMLMKEIVVCEVSVNDMLVDEDEEVSESQVCEEMPAENIEGVLQDDRKQLLEEIEFHKAKMDEMKVQEEELHQKLLECSQENCHLRQQVAALTADNTNWQKTVLQLLLNEDTLRGDDAKVAYYTGLPTFSVLWHTYELVSEKIPNSTLYVLPKFQQFLVVLMRIRLNLQGQDLAYRFNVSHSTVSRVFYKWLTAMSQALEQFLVWPDRETLVESTPLCFKKELGDSVGVIISCLEILTEKSTSVVSKDQNIVKFLIGITPQGTICHTSRSYFGAMSVKIVEESGILDKLLPGDIVMMDKGFNEADGDWVKARVVMSPTGKTQLSYDKKLSKRIANIGFHVERLSGLMKRKFNVLRSTLHVDYLSKKDGDEFSQIDLVVRVCCALTNLCPPVAME